MFDIHMSLKQNKNMKNANFMFIGTYYLVFISLTAVNDLICFLQIPRNYSTLKCHNIYQGLIQVTFYVFNF